jgi:hypothetical protein
MSSPTTGDKMKQAGQHAGQAAHEAAQGLGQKAQDLTHQASQKAQDLAHAAGQKVQDAAHAAGQKAEDATASVGGSLKSAAERVRENAPHEGMLGRGAEAVASTLERGGDYLQDRNLSGMADDITDMIRRNPIPAVLLGVGLGFLLGRTLRS